MTSYQTSETRTTSADAFSTAQGNGAFNTRQGATTGRLQSSQNEHRTGTILTPREDLIPAAPTPTRILAALNAGFESATDTTRFTRHERTGALFIQFNGYWVFVTDEGARDTNGLRLNLREVEHKTWNEYFQASGCTGDTNPVKL